MNLKLDTIYNQKDSKWKDILLGYNTNKAYTIGQYGCLLAVIATYCTNTGNKITPKELNEKIKKVGGYVANTGLFVWNSLGQIFPEYSLEKVSPRYADVEVPKAELDNIKSFIKEGYFLILEVDFDPASTGQQMHFVACSGLDEDENIIVYDPWIGKTRPLMDFGLPKHAIYSYKAYNKKVEIAKPEEIITISDEAIPYPSYKIILWRGLRVFIGGIIATLTVEVITRLVNIESMADLKSILVIVLTGGIAALGKWIRESQGNREQTSLIDKILI